MSRLFKNVPLMVGGVLAVLVLIVAVAVKKNAAPAERNRVVSAESQLRAGAQAIASRREFDTKCASCHGERGQGGSAAIDFSSAPAVAALTRAGMIDALKGRHGGRLAAPLKDEDKARLVDFIREYLMLPAPFEDAGVGRRIYSETCSVCHGERGDGASWAQNSLFPPPRDFASADAAALTRADMIAAATFGKEGTAMMPFATQLTPEEIAATVDYIRIAFMSGGAAAPPAETGTAAPAGSEASFLKGDASVGRALYYANCEQCHGRNGDGQGRRAYFMVIKPANFTSDAFRMRMDRARLHKAIAKGVVGSPMPAWDKVLPEDKIADLAEYVYSAFVAPEATEDDSAPAWKPDDQKKN